MGNQNSTEVETNVDSSPQTISSALRVINPRENVFYFTSEDEQFFYEFDLPDDNSWVSEELRKILSSRCYKNNGYENAHYCSLETNEYGEHIISDISSSLEVGVIFDDERVNKSNNCNIYDLEMYIFNNKGKATSQNGIKNTIVRSYYFESTQDSYLIFIRDRASLEPCNNSASSQEKRKLACGIVSCGILDNEAQIGYICNKPFLNSNLTKAVILLRNPTLEFIVGNEEWSRIKNSVLIENGNLDCENILNSLVNSFGLSQDRASLFTDMIEDIQ